MKKLVKWVGLVLLLGFVFVSGYKYGNESRVASPPKNVGRFELIDCKDCRVVRITQTVMNGPFLQAEPQQVWEVPAKEGQMINDPDNVWKMEIKEVAEDKISVNVTGKLYSALLPVSGIQTIQKDSPSMFDTGTVGGGAGWQIDYYDKSFYQKD